MHSRPVIPVLVLAFLACGMVVLAGCTQPPAPNASTTPQTTAVNISPLLLTNADLPPGFTVVAGQDRSLSDVGKMAKDLGWQGGYEVVSTDSAAGDPNGTVITQSIALYPVKNVPGIIGMVFVQDQSDTTLKYLNVTSVGEGGLGFYGKAPAQIVVKPTNQNPLATGNGSHDVEVVYPRDTAELIFGKGQVFEVIRITGPGTDPAVAESLARTAYEKIP